MSADFSEFTKRIPVKADADSIFDAWTIPSEFEKWFAADSEFVSSSGETRSKIERIESGDSYVWRWHGYADGAAEGGRVVQVDNASRSYSFTFAGDCIVIVEILNEDGENILQLTQSKIPANEFLRIFVGCGEGWTFYLANLKSHLEGGLDLRNKNQGLIKVINS